MILKSNKNCENKGFIAICLPYSFIIAGASFSVSASHGVISVAGAEGGVKVYAVDGLLVASSTAADATFEGLAKGVYIVSCGAQTVKVAL